MNKRSYSWNKTEILNSELTDLPGNLAWRNMVVMVAVREKITSTVENDDIIGSIAHAREILLCLARGINSISDIARECGFSKSTVHRLLKSLEKYDLAIENCLNRQYYLGALAKSLAANPCAPHRQLINCAADEMRRLAHATEETVALDTVFNTEYVHLFEIPSRHSLKVTQETVRAPSFSGIFAGATVKVLLAQLNEEKLAIILDNIKLIPETERASADKDVLMAQIKEIRRCGYSISRGERFVGTICAAAPIKGYYMPVVLSVTGPEGRLQPYLKNIVGQLVESSSRISERLIQTLKMRMKNGRMKMDPFFMAPPHAGSGNRPGARNRK